MSQRIRRHVDPFQCRFTITVDDWVERYRAHGQGDIWLDLGCGKGEFLAALAEVHPNLFFIGIEVRSRVAEKYFPKYKHIPNLLLLHGNVNLSIPSMMDHRKVQRVFINFPDPYVYKARYKKRQMVNERLVEGLCQILAPGGFTSIKSDNKALFDEMDALLSVHFQPLPTPAAAPLEQINPTEWENECRNKSVRVCSKDYLLR